MDSDKIDFLLLLGLYPVDIHTDKFFHEFNEEVLKELENNQEQCEKKLVRINHNIILKKK